MAEADYTGAIASVTVGTWRYTARFEPWPVDGVAQAGRNNAGGYLVAERRLTQVESDSPDDKRGLAGFLQAGLANARYNRITHYLGEGLVYTGLTSGDDRVGVTVAHAGLGGRYRTFEGINGIAVAAAETVAELTYRRSLTSFVTVQPDLQYIIHPSNGPTRPNALVLGLRLEIGK